MEKVLHCDCGFEVRGAGEARLVAEVRRHAWEAHGMALSQDEALLLAFRAELDEQAPSTSLPRRQPKRQGGEMTSRSVRALLVALLTATVCRRSVATARRGHVADTRS